MAFKKATKKQQKLRLAITGPAGAGKTYTALTLGKHLGDRMALIDTERGSASKYAGDVADFDTDELTHYAVENYLKAIAAARAEAYPVLVIDSLSHAWSGKGGILEEADNRGGKFQAWKQLTPMQHQLIDAILDYPGHVIATMRSKMTYEVSTEEGRNGKKETSVVKLGLAPVQREGVEYEFDVILDMSITNVATVTKSRCLALSGKAIPKPGKELAETLLAWLSEGAAPQAPRVDQYGFEIPTVPCPVVRPGKPNAGVPWEELKGGLIQKMHDENLGQMSADQRTWAVYLVKKRAARKAAEALAAEQAEAERALAAQQEKQRPFAQGEAGPEHSPTTSPTSNTSTTVPASTSSARSTPTAKSPDEGSEQPAETEGGCGADPADMGGTP
jgi:AAA domain